MTTSNQTMMSTEMMLSLRMIFCAAQQSSYAQKELGLVSSNDEPVKDHRMVVVGTCSTHSLLMTKNNYVMLLYLFEDSYVML